MSIDLPTRCPYCGMACGHLGDCPSINNVTIYSVLPHYAEDEDAEDNAPEGDTPRD